MSRARILTLAASALVCAAFAGRVAYGVFHSLPGEVDCHCGDDTPLFADPLAVATLTVTALCGAIGWAFAMVTLRTAHLPSAIPLVIFATVTAAAISASVVALLSPLVALGVGVGTMYWIRRSSA